MRTQHQQAEYSKGYMAGMEWYIAECKTQTGYQHHNKRDEHECLVSEHRKSLSYCTGWLDGIDECIEIDNALVDAE